MSLKVNILFSWVAHAVTLAIGFFLMPYILNTVGDNTYGTWLFLNTLAGQTTLLYLGFGDAISRYTAKHLAAGHLVRLNRTFSCITSVYLGSAMVAFGLSCLLAYWAPLLHSWPDQSLSEVRWAILLLGLNAAVSIAGSSFGGVLMGLQRFDIERSIVILVALLRLGLTVYFLTAQQGLLTLACIFLAITVLENLLACVMTFWLLPHLQFRWRHLRRETYRDCFGFSLFSFISLISESLIYMVDTIIIALFLGPVAVVPYYIALRLCEMIRLPVLQVGHVLLPKAGELHGRRDFTRLQEMVCLALGAAFLLSGTALIGALSFSDMMIQVWIGKPYVESYWVLAMLLTAHVVSLPTHLLRDVLTGIGYVRLPALVMAIQAVCNLALSLVLLQWLGIYGVALGTLIPMLVFEGGVLIPVGIRALQLQWSQLLRLGLLPQLIPLSLILTYCLLLLQWEIAPSWFAVISIVLGALVVLGSGVWLSRWNVRAKLTDSLRNANLAEGVTT